MLVFYNEQIRKSAVTLSFSKKSNQAKARNNKLFDSCMLSVGASMIGLVEVDYQKEVLPTIITC